MSTSKRGQIQSAFPSIRDGHQEVRERVLAEMREPALRLVRGLIFEEVNALCGVRMALETMRSVMASQVTGSGMTSPQFSTGSWVMRRVDFCSARLSRMS